MRSEREMMALILGVAQKDERIRAVWMNGSRTNTNAPKDDFQDYDIVYLVTERESFIRDPSWIDVFGKRVILQTPEDMSLFPSEYPDTYAYLMQFEDRNRIDLTLVPLEFLEPNVKGDRLTVILLDKDNRIDPIPPPSDEDYHVKKPSAAFYDDCCNEFWWVSTYVVKGLYRHEFLYAASHLNSWVREQLLQMLSWQVGIETGFSLSVGKSYKYLSKHLPEETWKRLRSTFKMDTEENIRTAFNETLQLFRESSKLVGKHLGFAYPDYDEKVTAYIEGLKSR
ncbi:aminoglycoside 6-adenylyltransferase [Leadbettera azotonutricia]|uniref:Aminoglycoside 6-adenylyltransferase (AAD(6)) n=1 Tax=Leadbettera azotonutricia (strain ATCC BAA-888 / DSM 13862 / ZAS-9) TaxID=545695 RepID=F5YA41_LEAAZ|nr:aminoglycoside 6-adenylyltransferase [Leadbettera azotonutricia]AEF83114.1 aminoglycoside 6-adenylyltransferase (AAD(6)) [Leadbettera azotonutricia ZAS-9]